MFNLNLIIMENLCLENYGVSKMSSQEMRTIEGGVIPVAAYYIGSFVVGVIVGLIIAHY